MKADNKSNSFFIFGSLYDFWDYTMFELKNYPNCQLINTVHFTENKLLYFIYKVHNSGLLNKYVHCKRKSIWYKYLFDNSKVQQNGGYNYFIFFDSNPYVYNPSFLEFLQSKIPNSRLVIVFVNSMKARNMRDIDYFKKYFSLQYTSDSSDALEFGFEHFDNIYSRVSMPPKPITTDVCFVGNSKGREDILLNLFDKMKGLGMSLDFTIIGLSQKREGISEKPLTYSEVLKKVQQSKCILEVCGKGQKSYTLRCVEAIVYNKMLITNNFNIADSKYFDKSKMFLFDSIEDISSIPFNKIIESSSGVNTVIKMIFLRYVF